LTDSIIALDESYKHLAMKKSDFEQKNRLLIIGKKPLPIGGVTRHVERLESHLINSDIHFIYKRLTIKEILNPANFLNNSKMHIHSSHCLVIFWLTIFSKVTNTKSIFTLHENLVKSFGFKRTLLYLSFKIADKPLVLNNQSYSITKKWNPNTQLIASFLPPTSIQPLKEKNLKKIQQLKSTYKYVFCTNAYDHKFDENGHEVYQITKVVELFNSLDNVALIVSDPSGNNLKSINNNKSIINKNIFFISTNHDFVSVIKLSDGLIRATTTDGDSVSIKEALYYDVPVITTDVIDRHESCILYKSRNYNELETIIKNFSDKKPPINKPSSCFDDLVKIYESI